MNNRYIGLIDALNTQKKEGVSIDEFAQTNNVTPRTIYNDLRVVKEISESLGGKISKLDNKRIQLIADPKMIAQIKKKLIFETVYYQYEDNPKTRQNEILMSLLLDSRPLSINKLSEKYYVSRTSITKTIKKIESQLPEKLYLSKSRVGMTVVGDASEKRRFAVNVIQEVMENIPEQTGLSDILMKIIPDIDISGISKVIQQVSKQNDFFLAEDIQIGILIHLCIMVKSDFSESIKASSKVIPQQIKDLCKEIIKSLEVELNIKVPTVNVPYLENFLDCTGINSLSIEPKDTFNDPLVKKFVDCLLSELESMFQFDFAEDQIFVKHLLWHCTSMFSRLSNGKQIQLSLAQEIRQKYPSVFNSISFLIFELLPPKYQNISLEEVSLLAMYIQSALEKRTIKKKVWVVCSEGLVFSELIKLKLMNYFPKLEVVRTLSIEEAEKFQESEVDIDFIISTKGFKSKLPIVEVSAMLPINDLEKIKSVISSQNRTRNRFFEEHELLTHLNAKEKSKEEVIEHLCAKLAQKNYVNTDYVQSVLEREKQLSTALTSRIALPHGSVKHVNKSAIMVCVLREPILWDHQFVDCVILLVIGEKNWEENKKRVTHLYEIISDETKVQALIKSRDENEIMKIFERY